MKHIFRGESMPLSGEEALLLKGMSVTGRACSRSGATGYLLQCFHQRGGLPHAGDGEVVEGEELLDQIVDDQAAVIGLCVGPTLQAKAPVNMPGGLLPGTNEVLFSPFSICLA